MTRAAKERRLALLQTESFRALPGLGVEARVGGRTVLLGNELLMAERGVSLGSLREVAERLAAGGKTPMFVALDETAAGFVAVADVPKASSRPAAAMSMSSVSVVTNALRLRGFDPSKGA